MRLPEDPGERSRMSPALVSALVAVTIFVFALVGGVLFLNSNRKHTGGNSDTPTEVASQKEEISLEETTGAVYPETEELLSESKLTPADLDFWDLYPEETPEEPVEEPVLEETEEEEQDPSTDGKHTKVINDQGKEEWVLISPYLPKHEYDFTRLVSQSQLMKYYEDGRQVSFVGVDISKNQDYVDFVDLKKAGIQYVMIRVGARGYSSGQIVIDEYFSENIKRATDAGLEVGVYFFSQAITKEEAVEEANLVLESIKDYKVTYPVAFDMEHIENDTARTDSLSRSQKTQIAQAFLETVKNAGYKPLLYGNKEWLIKQVDMTQLTAYDIWLSQAQDIPDYPYKFTMWQYNTRATIDGIAGYTNLNISFIDYSEK